MNWKAVKIIVVLIIALALLAFLRSGHSFDVRSIIPFMGGAEISLYDWSGLFLSGLVVWGLLRLNRDRSGR